MADNLTISIGADTSKMRADLALLQAQLKALGKDLAAAAKAGDVPAVNQTAAAYESVRKQSLALSSALKVQTGETHRADSALKELIHSGRGLGRVVGEFSNLSRGMESATGILGNLVGGFTGGLFGVAVARGFDALMEQIDGVAKRLTAIRDISRETGAKPLAVQGMQELAKEAGESADTANKFLTGLSSTLTKVATQTRDVQTGLKAGADAATDLNRNFATFGDKVVQVNRGGESVTRDFSDAIAILQVNAERLIKLPFEQQQRVLAQAFLRTEENAKRLGLTEIQLNAISKDVFGVPRESADLLSKALLNRGVKQDELAKAQRGASAAALRDIKEEAAAREKLSQAWQNTTAAIANSTAEARKGILTSTADLITNFPKSLDETLKTADKNATDQIQADWTAADLPSFFTIITNKITELFKNVKYVDPNASDQIQTEFADLPSFFTKLTDNLSAIWNRFWKSLSISAQAAELDLSKLDKTAAVTLNDVQVTAAATAGMPTVGRGPGTGPTGGYGPASFNQSAGYGPGSFPTQTILPGVSNYQAPPSKAVYPMAESQSKGWTDAVKTAAESSADAAEASKSAAEAAAKAANAVVNPSFRPYAAGGMIRGPGSGTSDSILARLSNGEFVMRASAVRAWGIDFMQSLNAFSDGGPVRPIPRFAAGGLVAAGGGTPVHLHLGGHSFALSGNEGVVSALVTEAHQQQMRSAGTKPSWYAGRPSGH